MHNAQLLSGDIRSFIPIGMDGAPVYQNAEAFRDAVERTPNLGERCARFLAVPRFNGEQSRADWYVPFAPSRPDGEYRIVSWQTAGEDERAAALKELSAFEDKLSAEGQKILSLAPTGDLLLFAHYLTGTAENERLPAIHFPGPEYIFIVDGQPVITFWGFMKPGDSLSASPFAPLRPAAPAFAAAGGGAVPPAGTAAAGTAAAAAAAAGHHCVLPVWLRWLLLLLLLLLLLGLLAWILHHFFGIRLPFFNLGDEEIALNEPRQEAVLPETEVNHEQVDLTNPHVTVSEGQLVPGSAAEESELTVPAADAVVPEEDAADEYALTEVPAAGLTEEEVPAEVTEPAAEELTEVPAEETAAALNGEQPAEPLTEEQTEAGAEQQTPVPSELSTGENAAEDNTAAAGTAAAADGKTVGTAQALRLDPAALSRGDLSAVEGSWQTRSGMMDINTGRPLNLSYRYQNGEGELIVRRQDGTRCTAKANPQASGSTLEIIPSSHAVCPDNSSYALPQIKCTPAKDGSAECYAEYSSSQRFPLRVYGADSSR